MSGVTDDDLDTESQRLLSDIQEMRTLEQQKRQTGRSTDEFHALADEVLAKADEIWRRASVERASAAEDSPLP